MNKKIAKLIADNDNKLPAFTFPGCYSIVYFDTYDQMYCVACAQENIDDISSYDVYWEGPSIECDGFCGTMLESEYGYEEE